MKPVEEQKCPNCGAPLRFDPDKGKLFCDNCDSEFEIENLNNFSEELEGFDFKSLNEKATAINPENLPVYLCKSCGTEIIARAEEASLTCPYCSNNIVLTEKLSGNLRPDAVVPFKITKDQLPKLMTEFYKDKILLPKNFFSDSRMSTVTGVYVPFWIFSGQIDGTLFFTGRKTSSHREGDYEVKHTDYFDVEREVSVKYDGIPVDASGRIADELMDSLEPFDLKESKEFDMRYLAGFAADRFDVPKNDIEERATKRMFSTTGNIAARDALKDYDNVDRNGGKLMAALDAKYVLLPVYLFNINYNNTDYRFAVNGQSGKVVGDIPIGKREARKHFFLRAGIVAAAIVVICLALFMMGV